MKLFLTLMLLCFTFTACQQQEREYMLDEDAFWADNNSRGGFYTDADGHPISGKVRSTRVRTDNITIIRTVKDGVINGTTEIYKNGQLFWHISLKYGVPHGKTINYYDNGNVKAEDNYHNGFLDGRSTFYYENGSLYMAAWTFRGHLIIGVFLEKGKPRLFNEEEEAWFAEYATRYARTK